MSLSGAAGNTAGDIAAYRAARGWSCVAILFALAIVSFLDRMVIAMLVGPIEDSLNLTDTQFSLAQGLAFALCLALSAIPLGMAIDRYSRRHVLFLGVIVWAVGCMGCGFAIGMASLILARMLVGTGEAVLTPSASSLIGDSFPPNRVGFALGVYGASSYVGYGVSLAAGGALISGLTAMGGLHLLGLGLLAPWRATFLIVGLPGFLLACLAFAIHDPRVAHQRAIVAAPPSGIGWRELFRARWGPLVPYLVGIAAMTGAFQIIAAWTPTYLIRKFGMSPGEVGLWLGLALALLASFGSVMGGIFVDRLARLGLTAAPFYVAIGAGVLCGPLLILAHLAANATAALTLLSAGLLIFGAIAAASFGSIQAIAPPAARGKVASLVVLTTAITAQGGAPLLVALITDHVFHDRARIGDSIAVVEALFCLIGVGAFAAGLAPLRNMARAQAAADTM